MIEVRDLVKTYPGATSPAVAGVSFTVEQGGFYTLLGPSGCGKTTTLRCIAGLERPDSGMIKLGQTVVVSDRIFIPTYRRDIGMVFQNYAVWPHMTVFENVAFPLRVGKQKVAGSEIDRRVRESLALVGLAGLEKRMATQLSGGQQQRLSVARALVREPDVLLLDEPLSNLDAKLRLEMRAEIRRVCKEFSLTTVYVTHDQKEALSIADRLAVLDGGRILQVGTPGEIYRRPASKTVATFIGETDCIDGTVVAFAAGRVTVETAIGRFEGVPGDPAAACGPGDRVTLSVRPECWALSRERPAGNAVAGRIGESVYLGELAQYEFVTAGVPLKILELNPRFLDAAAGGVLFAGVAADDVVVLQR